MPPLVAVRTRAPSSLFMLLGLLLTGVSSAEAQVAVVVNRANSQHSVSLSDLRDLFLGTRTHFKKSDERVVLLESVDIRAQFYDTVLRMSEGRVKRHWIGLVFSGQGVMPPRDFRAPKELLRYVAAHPGAIGFVPLRVVDTTVKVLAVEGFHPTDTRYPIR